MSDNLQLQLSLENGAGNTILDIDATKYKYIGILNNSAYTISVYKGQSNNIQDRIFQFPIYSILTVPLPKDTPNRLFLNWVGVGNDIVTLILSNEILFQNQTLITPGGGAAVIIAGDGVGLARQAQLPPALFGGLLGVSVQGGNVGITPGQTVGLTAGAEVKITDGVDDLAINADGSINVKIPAGEEIKITDGADDLAINADGSINIINNSLPTEINEYSVTMTLANTEYSQVLPAGTKSFEIYVQSNDVDFRIAFSAGKVATGAGAIPIKSGNGYYKEGVNLTGKTLYFGCGTAGKTVTIVAYN